jgi:hypothetical protein
MMLFSLPKIKCLSLFPELFTFIYSSTLYPSLSLFPELLVSVYLPELLVFLKNMDGVVIC